MKTMASMRPLSFGELLRRYRASAGLTQEELAEKAGLSKRGIGALETGERLGPQKETVDRLADALELDPSNRALFAAAARQRLSAHSSQDSSAPPVAWTPRSRRMLTPPLVGRSSEVMALQHHLAGEGAPLLVLSGEP